MRDMDQNVARVKRSPHNDMRTTMFQRTKDRKSTSSSVYECGIAKNKTSIFLLKNQLCALNIATHLKFGLVIRVLMPESYFMLMFYQYSYSSHQKD